MTNENESLVGQLVMTNEHGGVLGIVVSSNKSKYNIYWFSFASMGNNYSEENIEDLIDCVNRYKKTMS